MRNRLISISHKIRKDFENFDIYTKICMNKFCALEFTSEQSFGRNYCSGCGAGLRLKNEVIINSRFKKMLNKNLKTKKTQKL